MTWLRVRVMTWRVACTVLATTLFAFSLVGTAQANPAAITKAQKEAQALSALVDRLSNDLSKVDEDYNYANQQLQRTQAAVKKTTAKLAAAQKDLEAARHRLTDRLTNIYKSGRAGAVAALLSSSSFSDLVNRFGQLQRIGRQDSQLLAQVKACRAEVADRQSQLTAQLKAERARATETAAAKRKVQGQLALQQKLLKGKEAQIAQLKKEEAVRQARLAAAARATAQRAAFARARAAVARATAATTTHSGNSGGPSSNGSGAKVVSIAMQYLGVPYVWAGSTPSGFDCSGLVSYVYAKVGISLPHSSRMIYGYGTPVTRGQLEPGDLLFFYNPIHHVAIYIGNGQMINARGSQVQIDDVWTDSYYGAKRIL